MLFCLSDISHKSLHKNKEKMEIGFFVRTKLPEQRGGGGFRGFVVVSQAYMEKEIIKKLEV